MVCRMRNNRALVAKNTHAYAFIRTRVYIRKADSVGVRFLFVYAYSVFSSMIGFIYLSAARFFFTCSVSLRKSPHRSIYPLTSL